MIHQMKEANTLYRPSKKERILAAWQSIRCALVGSLATLMALGAIWCVQNAKALSVVISHPDIVAGLKIESFAEIKK